MRDRLIELLAKTIAYKNENTDDYIEWLADELLENGVIVPPCKVGDKVYVWSKTLPTHEIDSAEIPEYYEGEVVSMRKNKHGCFFKVRIYARWTTDVFDYDIGNYTESYMSPRCFTYPMSAVGKKVFLTREKAEQALTCRKSRQDEKEG